MCKFCNEKEVIVLGMHRSGTSLMANVLCKLGINMGRILKKKNYINQYFKNTVKHKTRVLNSDLKNVSILNYVISNNNLLNISQIGNNNHINVKANSNIQNINQNGNHNNYEFISYNGKKDLNFEIQQSGNYNLIQVLGENSIIDNLKIVQKSDFKRITITNY